MPLIFVHGVNNRKEDPEYETNRLVTEAFLKQHLGGVALGDRVLPAGFEINFPYWGDLATTFAWNMRSLPSGEIDALGAPSVASELRPLIALIKDALGDAKIALEEPLVTVANYSFPLAVEILCDALIVNPLDRTASEIAEFVVTAQSYAIQYEPPAKPSWLTTTSTDAQFIALLLRKMTSDSPPADDALGPFSRVGNAVSAAATKLKQAVTKSKTKVIDTVGDFASTKVLAWNRRSLNATLGRFFGDVFIYLNGRGEKDTPGTIPAKIVGEWDQAIAAEPDDPVIIIGHSLGGVISYDLLSHFRPDIVVDLFVSVGSQISHFEELKLFRTSDLTIPNGDFSRRVSKPPNIRRWINVFDEVDIFSYACDKIFDGVHDFHYNTGTYVVKAHSAYFTQKRFYQRLRARIDEF